MERADGPEVTGTKIKTLIIIYLAREWRIFHRRHLIRALAEALPTAWEILCVDRPITFDVTVIRRPRRLARELPRRQPRRISPTLSLFTPWQLSHELVADRLPGLPRVNRWLVRRQMLKVLARHYHAVDRTISWIYHPIQAGMQASFPGDKSIYECYDEYGMDPDGTPRERIQKKEKTVLAGADLTFVTADELARRRQPHARKIVYLPNGVPEIFGEPQTGDSSPLTPGGKPCIGYLGHLRSEIDLELLENLAIENPEWRFVFIGPVEKKTFTTRLRRLAHVEFLGPQPYERLPALLRRLDVGLAPFILNDFTRAINPLKIYEYMAAGVPVVASDLPELHRFKDVIRISENTSTAFAKAITETLAANRAAQTAKLVRTARDYTWEKICRDVIVPELRRLLD